MGAIAICVEYEVKPEHRKEFETLIRAHGAGTMSDEEGCVRFDVLIPREGTGNVMLYELYRDEKAYAAHNRSPRLPKVREAYKHMITNKRLVICDVT